MLTSITELISKKKTITKYHWNLKLRGWKCYLPHFLDDKHEKNFVICLEVTLEFHLLKTLYLTGRLNSIYNRLQVNEDGIKGNIFCTRMRERKIMISNQSITTFVIGFQTTITVNSMHYIFAGNNQFEIISNFLVEAIFITNDLRLFPFHLFLFHLYMPCHTRFG